MFPFLLRGAHKKNSSKIGAFPLSNRTRNRTRTAAEFCSLDYKQPLFCYTVVAVIITVLIPRNYMAVTLLITVM